jgi:hypothetical protein
MMGSGFERFGHDALAARPVPAAQHLKITVISSSATDPAAGG